MDELIKITPDKERAASILKMSSLIEERINAQNPEKMAPLIISDYYEIMKELATAILFIEGYKTLGHKELIHYLEERHKSFTGHEISVLDSLRIMRNRISYEGLFVEPDYLLRNEKYFKDIIQKMKNIILKNNT